MPPGTYTLAVWNETVRGDPPRRPVTIAPERRRRRRGLHDPMSVFSSLTNRIFLATALLAVLSIGVAIYIVNRARDARRRRTSCSAASPRPATLVEEYRTLLFETSRARPG